ncbi:MAG: hypothetical protein J07HX64_02331 [halophilic archaeon J07HX64]|nr:MAG: hypothetical protein J07HX64_02331 [halophilic archaeon J07HX64]
MELTPGSSATVTTAYEVENTTAFDIMLATDDDETTKTVSWDSARFSVSGLEAPGQVGVNETVTVNATVENTGSGAGTRNVRFALDRFDNFDDTGRDIRAYERNVTFDPDVAALTRAGLAGFPDSPTLVVNNGDADESEVRPVATATEAALTPVVAGQLAFDPAETGETTLGIDAEVSQVPEPGGAARDPVFSNGGVTVESTAVQMGAAVSVGSGVSAGRYNPG